MKKFMSLMLTLAMLTIFCIMPCVNAFGTEITPTDPSTDAIGNVPNIVIGAIRWVGYIVAVAVLVYIGIKYVMASASEKAELKGLLIKYVIGAGLIIFGTQIAAWAFSIGGSATATE